MSTTDESTQPAPDEGSEPSTVPNPGTGVGIGAGEETTFEPEEDPEAPTGEDDGQD